MLLISFLIRGMVALSRIGGPRTGPNHSEFLPRGKWSVWFWQRGHFQCLVSHQNWRNCIPTFRVSQRFYSNGLFSTTQRKYKKRTGQQMWATLNGKLIAQLWRRSLAHLSVSLQPKAFQLRCSCQESNPFRKSGLVLLCFPLIVTELQPLSSDNITSTNCGCKLILSCKAIEHSNWWKWISFSRRIDQTLSILCQI